VSEITVGVNVKDENNEKLSVYDLIYGSRVKYSA